MKVLFYSQLNNEIPTEVVLGLDELPPQAKHELRQQGVGALMRDYRFWRNTKGQLWWWVRPIPQGDCPTCGEDHR